MRPIALSLIMVLCSLVLSNVVYSQTSGGFLQCGIKPIPKIGCSIGRCVNGVWEQDCSRSVGTCGIKPIPDIGCTVGRCVNGKWEQICNATPTLKCGLKPLPQIGCRVGQCVNGEWEQVCSEDNRVTIQNDNSTVYRGNLKGFNESYSIGDGIASLGESIGNALKTRKQTKQFSSLLQSIILINKIEMTGEINAQDRELLASLGVSVTNYDTIENVVYNLIQKLNYSHAEAISILGIDNYKKYLLLPLDRITAKKEATQQLEKLLPELKSMGFSEIELQALTEVARIDPIKGLEMMMKIKYHFINHSSANEYTIELAQNDELFIINGERFQAQVHCLGWMEGDRVIFLEGSPYGGCFSALLYNSNNGEKCHVWCE